MNAFFRKRSNKGESRRRGAATVEFAVCMPVVILLVMGSVEAVSMIFLKQSLQTAAYEATRRAIRLDGSASEAVVAGQTILDARNIEQYEITFPLGQPEAAARGQSIAVEVSAPSAPNSPIAGRFVPNRDLTVRTTMVKE